MANFTDTGNSAPTKTGTLGIEVSPVDDIRNIVDRQYPIPTSVNVGSCPSNQSSFGAIADYIISEEELLSPSEPQYNKRIDLKGRTINIATGFVGNLAAPGRFPLIVIHFKQYSQQEFMRYTINDTSAPSSFDNVLLPPGVIFQPPSANAFFTFEEEFDYFYVSILPSNTTGKVGDFTISVAPCKASRIL